jgi:protein subunit release factor B
LREEAATLEEQEEEEEEEEEAEEAEAEAEEELGHSRRATEPHPQTTWRNQSTSCSARRYGSFYASRQYICMICMYIYR